MKPSRGILMGLVVVSTMMMLVASALAAEYVCNVKQAGVKGKTDVRIFLTDVNGDFKNREFKALTTRTNEMLAIAMTAMTGGMRVKITTNLSGTTPPTISAMYLVK